MSHWDIRNSSSVVTKRQRHDRLNDLFTGKSNSTHNLVLYKGMLILNPGDNLSLFKKINCARKPGQSYL